MCLDVCPSLCFYIWKLELFENGLYYLLDVDRSIYFGASISSTLTAKVQRGGNFFAACIQAVYNTLRCTY